MSRPRVAVLGLGLMGGGMARRVVGAGFPLAVYNRDRAKAEPLAGAGAQVAVTPREAGAGAEVIISMLADDGASRAVWLGADGALAGAARGAVCIESSTATVAWVRELAAAAAAHGCAFLDAPVTGSRVHAASGELNFLVGGDAATLDRVRPVLEAMSQTIQLIGPTGSGALLKLINNAMCGTQAVALAEALALVEKSGLDREKGVALLTGGAGGSPLVKTLAGRMIARDYDPNFVLRLMAKDLTYALGEAEKHAQPATVFAAALDVFRRGITAGQGERDMAAVVEQFRANDTAR